jgi:hypothetical protein
MTMKISTRDRLHRLAFYLSVVAVISCGDSTGPDTDNDVASVVITSSARTFTAVNDSARMAAEARNASGQSIPRATITWFSLETDVASVDQTGMVKAKANGTARIVASASGKADTVNVTVTQTVARVVLSPQADTINAIGDTVAFTALVTDANDVPVANPTIVWSSTSPATLSVAGGKVVSLATGSGMVIATVGGIADTVTVLSRQIAATLTVSPSPLAIDVGQSRQLTATAADSNGVAIPASAMGWTSASPATASVSGSGMVKGEAAGSTTVTVNAPGKTVDIPVTVRATTPAGPLTWTIEHRTFEPEFSDQLTGLLGASSSDVFSVGAKGSVFRYDGNRWTLRTMSGLPNDATITSFWGPNSSSLWATATDFRFDPITSRFIQFARVLRQSGGAWTSAHVGADGQFFYDISGTSESDIWVVGEGILHYDGAAWTPAPIADFATDFTAVWAVAPNTAFAGTEGGALFQYDGTSWRRTALGNGYRVTDLWASSASDAWVVDAGGFVRHWNGTDWRESTRFNGGLSVVGGTSPTNVWVGGSSILARWNGATWFSVDPATTRIADPRGMWFSSSGGGWFVTPRATLSELRADGWTVHWDSPGTFWDVTGAGSDVWTCGTWPIVPHRSGGVWRTERLPRAEGCVSMTARSISDVLVAAAQFTASGVYFRYDGSQWTAQGGLPGRMARLWTVPGGETYGVSRTTVYRFDQGVWTALPPTGSPQDLRALWASGPNDIFASGDQGTVMHYDGTSWTKLTTGTTATLHGVWGSSPTDVYFVGADINGALVLHYDGNSFTTTRPGGRVLLAIHGRSPNAIYAVGEQGLILRFNGSSWIQEQSGVTEHLEDVWMSPGADVYVVGSNALILHGAP